LLGGRFECGVAMSLVGRRVWGSAKLGGREQGKKARKEKKGQGVRRPVVCSEKKEEGGGLKGGEGKKKGRGGSEK